MIENFNFPVPNITNNFSISFEGHKRLEQFITEVTIPGLNIGQQEVYLMNQRFKQPPRAVEPEYDELIATFTVTEDYSNYFEIWRWIKDYKHSIKNNDVQSLLKDIILINYDLNKKIIRKIYYKYCFPSMLSDITLSNTQNDIETAVFTVNFIVNDIIIEEINTD